MGSDEDINKYGVSLTFEKILAHNVPGILFTVVLAMFVDIITEEKIFLYVIKNIDFKVISIIILCLIFLGFVFGLMIDELKHILIENKIYTPVAKSKRKKFSSRI